MSACSWAAVAPPTGRRGAETEWGDRFAAVERLGQQRVARDVRAALPFRQMQDRLERHRRSSAGVVEL